MMLPVLISIVRAAAEGLFLDSPNLEFRWCPYWQAIAPASEFMEPRDWAKSCRAFRNNRLASFAVRWQKLFQ
eukprot:6082355-Amphidinium_carterae.1